MKPPVTAVIEAEESLRRLVAEVDGSQVSAPSPLPGWSRGHLLAHLTDNARMFARQTDYALRGELIETYDGGQAERDAIIEATAHRTADAHRSALREHSTRLEQLWSKVSDDDWGRPVWFRDAELAATVYARWREVWIHMVDLELGVGPADWPEALAAHVIDFLLVRLPAGTVLTAQDVSRQWSAPGTGGAAITGNLRDLAAWIAGRTPQVAPQSPQGLPELGPWPAQPTPAA